MYRLFHCELFARLNVVMLANQKEILLDKKGENIFLAFLNFIF